jgi:hypothetical protein
MAINIQTLFADIIDTPEQRQQKLLQQGMMQGQLLASGLRGRAAALAPLAQVAGQLGVQRQEDLRRAVQPMIGIDPRTTGEKLAEQLGQIDTSTPEGLMQAAQAIQSVDPVRAAALRQASVEATRAEEERELRLKGERQRQELAQNREERAITAAQQDNELFGLNRDLTTIRLSKARQDELDAMEYKGNIAEFANEIEQLGFATQASGLRRRLLDPQNVMSNIAAQMKARLEASQLSDFEPIVGNKADQFIELAQSRDFFDDVMSTGFWGGKPEKSRAEILDMAARVKQLNPSASDGEILDTVEVLIKTGAGQGLNDVSDSDIEQMAQEQAGSRDNYDPEASAAIAAAQLGESPSSQAPPQQISKEDAQSLGYVPQGYTEMTSGLLQLTDDTSSDWIEGKFADKAAPSEEVMAEYRRINPSMKYNPSALTRAKQIVAARNQ